MRDVARTLGQRREHRVPMRYRFVAGDLERARDRAGGTYDLFRHARILTRVSQRKPVGDSQHANRERTASGRCNLVASYGEYMLLKADIVGNVGIGMGASCAGAA